MRGIYTASARISGLAGAKTLLLIQASSNRVLEVLSASVSNESNETNEQLMISLHHAPAGTVGSPTGTAVTPSKHEAGDGASNSIVKSNLTAGEPAYVDDGGREIVRKAMTTVGGWRYRPGLFQRPRFASGDALGLRLRTTPSAPFDAVVSVTYRERGEVEPM